MHPRGPADGHLIINNILVLLLLVLHAARVLPPAESAELSSASDDTLLPASFLCTSVYEVHTYAMIAFSWQTAGYLVASKKHKKRGIGFQICPFSSSWDLPGLQKYLNDSPKLHQGKPSEAQGGPCDPKRRPRETQRPPKHPKRRPRGTLAAPWAPFRWPGAPF